MRTKILNYALLLAISSSLSSCSMYETSLKYSEDLKVGYASSKPIYLTNSNSKAGDIYFLLNHKLNTEKYELKVRWVSTTRAKHFNGKDSTLKFMVDQEEILSFEPYKPIRTVAYHMDSAGTEEEACYILTREQLERIAKAKNVVVNVQGKYENKVANFNRFHTSKAFKDFLKNI